jgi:hypothetical protein
MKRGLLVLAMLCLSCADCGGTKPAPSSGPASSAAPSAAQPSKPPVGGLTALAVNERIRAEWKKEGVEPAPEVTDARFLRRIYVDIAGVIPPPEKVTAFLADTAPNKRARAVDELLASPRYADHFTDVWDRILMGRSTRGKLVDRAAFRAWLRGQFEKNAPYTKFVADLITATGQNSEGGASYKEPAMPAPTLKRKMPEASDEGDGDAEEPGNAAPVNGAVNWLLRYNQTPADLSGAASRVFLGVQIQCAQCHDHKTEKWKVDDFKSFTACFTQARIKPIDPPKTKGLRRVEVEDVKQQPRGAKPKKKAMRELADAKPAALDGTDLSDSPNRRQALAAWMTSPENPWFAQAIVNRMWAHFLGRGFVEPIDDLRPGNPGVMPDLLDQIAKDFAAGSHDLKKLIRLITATEAYQRAAAPGKGESVSRLWARFRVEPIGTNELLDSIIAATKLEPVLEKVAGGSLDAIKAKIDNQVTFLFDVDEEPAGDDQFNGTIPQALFLLNGLLVGGGSSAIPGAALREVLAMPGGDDVKIRSLYLRTLSREPSAEETARWVAFVSAPQPPEPDADAAGAKPKAAGKKAADPLRRIEKMRSAEDPRGQAYEDLFWALLNSSEFVLNH